MQTKVEPTIHAYIYPVTDLTAKGSGNPYYQRRNLFSSYRPSARSWRSEVSSTPPLTSTLPNKPAAPSTDTPTLYPSFLCHENMGTGDTQLFSGKRIWGTTKFDACYGYPSLIPPASFSFSETYAHVYRSIPNTYLPPFFSPFLPKWRHQRSPRLGKHATFSLALYVCA